MPVTHLPLGAAPSDPRP